MPLNPAGCGLSTMMQVCTFWDGVAPRPTAVRHTPELVPVRMTVGITRAVNRERTMASKNLFVPSLEQMAEDHVTTDLWLTTLYCNRNSWEHEQQKDSNKHGELTVNAFWASCTMVSKNCLAHSEVAVLKFSINSRVLWLLLTSSN